MVDVRLELAEEDLRVIASGSIPEHQISPSKFIQMGLDIEEQQ
jgi:hypothetical protein